MNLVTLTVIVIYVSQGLFDFDWEQQAWYNSCLGINLQNEPLRKLVNCDHQAHHDLRNVLLNLYKYFGFVRFQINVSMDIMNPIFPNRTLQGLYHYNKMFESKLQLSEVFFNNHLRQAS